MLRTDACDWLIYDKTNRLSDAPPIERLSAPLVAGMCIKGHVTIKKLFRDPGRELVWKKKEKPNYVLDQNGTFYVSLYTGVDPGSYGEGVRGWACGTASIVN